ncbi:MAG: serine hydrolase [Balneolaceae bacterium]
MKRALTFLFIFLVVIAGIFALVIGLNYQGFKTLYQNEEGMVEGSQYIENTYSLKGLAEFIGDQPEYFSITSYNAADPDSGIFFEPDTPRTLGTTANLILLIEYERQVAEGLLNPEETVRLNDIQEFSLPKISENNHQNLVDEFSDGNAPLDDVVSAMIAYNDIAAADYLWFRFGEENIRALTDSLNFPENSLPIPFSGMYITINPSLNDTVGLSEIGFTEFAKRAIKASQNLAEDQAYQQVVKEQFEKDRLSLTFIQERDALDFFPQASTNAMADLMYRLLHGEIISAEVSEEVVKKLRWLMHSERIVRSFDDYGGIYDNRMGLLAGVDFGTSIYDGHTSVQAIFFDQLPVGFWVHLSANHMHEDFQQRLIWDPALYEITFTEIESGNE